MAASKPRALWLRLRNTPILRMLRLEEALFRAYKAHSWFLTNEWDGPAEAANAAVLGISGKADEMLDVEAVRAAAHRSRRSGSPRQFMLTPRQFTERGVLTNAAHQDGVHAAARRGDVCGVCALQTGQPV